MTKNLECLTLDDPRISDDCRQSEHVAELLRDGVSPYWDAETLEVRWIKPSSGKLERVVVANAFSHAPTTRRERLVRKFYAQSRQIKNN